VNFGGVSPGRGAAYQPKKKKRGLSTKKKRGSEKKLAEKKKKNLKSIKSPGKAVLGR